MGPGARNVPQRSACFKEKQGTDCGPLTADSPLEPAELGFAGYENEAEQVNGQDQQIET